MKVKSILVFLFSIFQLSLYAVGSGCDTLSIYLDSSNLTHVKIYCSQTKQLKNEVYPSVPYTNLLSNLTSGATTTSNSYLNAYSASISEVCGNTSLVYGSISCDASKYVHTPNGLYVYLYHDGVLVPGVAPIQILDNQLTNVHVSNGYYYANYELSLSSFNVPEDVGYDVSVFCSFTGLTSGVVTPNPVPSLLEAGITPGYNNDWIKKCYQFTLDSMSKECDTSLVKGSITYRGPYGLDFSSLRLSLYKNGTKVSSIPSIAVPINNTSVYNVFNFSSKLNFPVSSLDEYDVVASCQMANVNNWIPFDITTNLDGFYSGFNNDLKKSCCGKHTVKDSFEIEDRNNNCFLKLKYELESDYCDSCQISVCDVPYLNNGLVLNLPFNGNTQDVSGNGNHATNYGATPTVGKNGLANTAYQFNGSSYMKILNSTSLNPSNDITITAVVRVNTFNGDNCNGNQIIKKGNNDFQFGEYAIGFSPNAYTGGCFGNDPNHQNYVGYLYDNRPTSSMVNNAPYIKTQEWDCIVFTKDSDSCKTYVNGVVRQSFSSKLYGSNSDDVYIGKTNHTTYPFWFNGTIDDIRLYNRALSASEVNAYCGTCSSSPNNNLCGVVNSFSSFWRGYVSNPASVFGCYSYDSKNSNFDCLTNVMSNNIIYKREFNGNTYELKLTISSNCDLATKMLNDVQNKNAILNWLNCPKYSIGN